MHRIASAVAQKNGGESYLQRVNESGGLSPGKVFARSAKKSDRAHVKRKLFAGTTGRFTKFRDFYFKQFFGFGLV